MKKKHKKVERIIEVFYIYNYENIVNQNVVKKKRRRKYAMNMSMNKTVT